MDLNRFIAEVVRPAVHPDRRPFEVAAHHVHGEPIPAAQALRAGYAPFEVGEPWGARWDTTWFRLRATIPAAWSGAEVAALVHLGGQRTVGFSAEGLIWTAAGQPVQGLHHHQRQYVLTRRAQGGKPVELYVEAAANPVPRWHTSEGSDFGVDYGGRPLYRLEQAELAVVNRQVAALLSDLEVVLELAEGLNSSRAEEALEAAVKRIDAADVAGSVAGAREVLAPVLAVPSEWPHVVTAVGHAHIDTAWLWPIRETKRKCARTFANQLRLLEAYDEHRFVCSQAVQYQWIKEDYPQLYEQIAARVADGRWEPVGGMWVEPDTNMPSGESLVRQVVYGKRFFADEFGVATPRAVDSRRVRVLGRLAAGRRPGRRHRPGHSEAELERHQRLPPFDVLVGGSRRQPGAGAFPAGEHLQRRLLGGGAARQPATLQRARPQRAQPLPVWVRRRWRRTDCSTCSSAPGVWQT